MTTRNLSLIFAAVPDGVPVPGKHLKVEDRPIDLNAAPPKGALLIKILASSFDPYQRGRMRASDGNSYINAFTLNQPITNSAVAKVVASASDRFKPGDLVSVDQCNMAEYALLPADQVVAKPYGGVSLIPQTGELAGVDVNHYLGALGMPGTTAYASFYEIAGPFKKGETIFISSAAGAVGMLVGQLAKREGMHVIGSVGSAEKLKWLTEEAGFDSGFNYKEEKPLDALNRLAPKGLDVYYDNVGAEQLDAALAKMNPFGRIVACGQISQYNLSQDQKYGVKNTMQIVGMRLKFQGFISFDANMGPKYREEHQRNMTKWIKDGSIKTKLHETAGIENAPEGLVGLFKGENFGKAVLIVSKL